MKELKRKNENRKVRFHNKDYEIDFYFYVDDDGNEYLTPDDIESNNHELYSAAMSSGLFFDGETVKCVKAKKGLTVGKEYKINIAKTYYGAYVIVRNDDDLDNEYEAWCFDIIEDDEEEFEYDYEE